jgi:hypothetical protein
MFMPIITGLSGNVIDRQEGKYKVMWGSGTSLEMEDGFERASGGYGFLPQPSLHYLFFGVYFRSR